MSETFPPLYLDLSKPAPQRLAALRMATVRSVVEPFTPTLKTWRDARRYGFGNYGAAYCALAQGFNGEGRSRVPVWYAHVAPSLRIVDAADVMRAESHRFTRRTIDECAWYTDPDDGETATAIVVRLSHGRAAAGYRLSSNDEIVIFGDVFDGEDAAIDAARMACEHARIAAESEREYNERYSTARGIEDAIESNLESLRVAFALRNHPTLGVAQRKALRIAVATVRDLRDELTRDYADVL